MHSTDALPLPPRPDVAQYKKLAKELLTAVRTGETAVRTWAKGWFTRLVALSGAQGYSDEGLERDAQRFAAYWTGERKVKDIPPPRPTLAHAQFIIARVHGFTNWAALVHHIETLWKQDSSVARFETAVDALVIGDDETLRSLLRAHPELVHQRSSRDHRCTLLHYVSANGVEGYRQRTPPNILDITRLLLQQGADVNATAQCYGDDDTVLGLTATSTHPHNAGVMIPLLELLVSAGADVSYRSGGWTMVRACLANGQPDAARWLADHGSTLDLAGAAGIGRLDGVQRFVAPDGALTAGASREQLREAWEFTAWYGQVDVARYLMDAGMDPGFASDGGATALHRAAYAGHADLVDLLLARGAPADVVDTTYGTTPLVWAQHAWKVDGKKPAESYRRIVAALGGDPDA